MVFDKLMNSYYYGKAGKGDLTKEDLPANRWELFWTTLRVRFAQLIRLNLLHVAVWLPTIAVLVLGYTAILSISAQRDLGDGTSFQSRQALQSDVPASTMEALPVLDEEEAGNAVRGVITQTLLLLFPCIAITGPVTAGVSYVTRNWARDEHAFLWSDLKDAVKANWRQALAVSVITGAVPLIAWMGWQFYGGLAAGTPLMLVPMALVVMVCIAWWLSVTYMYPMLVTYELKLRDIIKNALLLAVARLPQSLGIRLLHALPLAVAVVISIYHSAGGMWFAVGYYTLIGFSLSRFISASYTNGVFDRFINPRISGAVINRGLRERAAEADE